MNAECAGKTVRSLEKVSYLSALEVRSRRGAIQIHVYLLPYNRRQQWEPHLSESFDMVDDPLGCVIHFLLRRETSNSKPTVSMQNQSQFCTNIVHNGSTRNAGHKFNMP